MPSPHPNDDLLDLPKLLSNRESYCFNEQAFADNFSFDLDLDVVFSQSPEQKDIRCLVPTVQEYHGEVCLKKRAPIEADELSYNGESTRTATPPESRRKKINLKKSIHSDVVNCHSPGEAFLLQILHEQVSRSEHYHSLSKTDKALVNKILGKLLTASGMEFISNSTATIKLEEDHFKSLEALIVHKTSYKNKRVDQSLKKVMSIILSLLRKRCLPMIKNQWSKSIKTLETVEKEINEYGEVKSGGKALKTYVNKLIFKLYFKRESKDFIVKQKGLAMHNEADSLMFIKNGVTSGWINLANNNFRNNKKCSDFMSEISKLLKGNEIREEFMSRNKKMISNIFKKSGVDFVEEDKAPQTPYALIQFDEAVAQTVDFFTKYVPASGRLF